MLRPMGANLAAQFGQVGFFRLIATTRAGFPGLEGECGDNTLARSSLGTNNDASGPMALGVASSALVRGTAASSLRTVS